MKRRISAVTLIFIFFLVYGIPRTEASETIGHGAFSRVPMVNGSIEKDFFFDGANYEMITPYGNYVFLQPNNIMEYWDLDGNEVIDKSVWVLQHDTSGMWLSLLDFDNQRISLVNETVYEIAYDVKYKNKGPSRIVGSVEIGFYSSGYSMNEPKIIVNFTKSVEWENLGMGSFRWIWDIVPKGSWTKYVNETSKINTDILNYEVSGKSSKIYFSKMSEYSDLEKWIVLDISDYGSVDFRGGDESFFNTRGFIIIFPENEGDIDPVTIANGFDATSTAIEQQRKVFKNPRGLEYYYALFETSDNNFDFYDSSDGITWSETIIDIDYFTASDTPDICIYEDEANNRLMVGVVISDSGNENVNLYGYAINDTLSDLEYIFSSTVALETDDATYNPNIEIDDDGYIWVTWADEFTNKGSQRHQLRSTRSTTPYPVTSPAWEVVVNLFGEEGSAIYPNGLEMGVFPLKSELVRVIGTYNVTVVFTPYDDNVGFSPLMGLGLTAPAGAITEGGLMVLAANVGTNMLVSSVSESGLNGSVFSLFREAGDLKINEWNISAGTDAEYGEVMDLAMGDGPNSLSLSINQTANPDMLICLWSNTTAGSLWSESTEVDSFSLEGLFEVEGEVQAVDYFSSSGIDESGEVYLIYTMANNTVRFYNVVLPPEILIPDTPELLYGAGFNGSDGFVLIYWNHTLLDYTDFEVHNSSDGVLFTFLNNVSLPWFNHTGLTNMTYIYYRVRARNFIPFFNQYFNSSWSAINLERVRFEKGAPATEVFQLFWIVLAIALMLIGIVISKMWFEEGAS